MIRAKGKGQRAKVKKRRKAAYRTFSFLPFTFSFARQRAGFTLLELVVSFGIFSVVIITAIGAVIAISNAETKATNIQDIQDNLRFALESMTKEMRTGKGFTPSGGVPPAYAAITFTRSDGAQVTYCTESSALKKVTGASASCSAGSAITSDALIVDQVTFYAIGFSLGASDGQPRITVSLRAHSRDPKLGTSFRLQTTITQRERDR